MRKTLKRKPYEKSVPAMLQFFFLHSMAQDTTKGKPTGWLGMLTLTEKYKDEKSWTTADQAIVGEHFQRLIKKKGEGIVVLAGRTDLPLDNPDMAGLVIFYAKDEKEAR
jgi:hypothetical protein